jgi:hypothetical protein
VTITVNTPDGGTAQFPDGTPTGAMTSALQAKFGAPAASASAPSDNDYSKSPLSAIGRTFESSADWGTGDLIRAAMTGKKPSETAAQSSAAAASLPWYVRYPTEAAGYGFGLANLLDPVTDAAEAGAAGLGAGATLSKIAGTAAEGATVGGVSHVAGSDDPGLTDTAGAALGGAALGGAAGAAAPLANKALTGVFGKAGSIDPAAATAATEAIKTAKYGDLHAPGAPSFSASAVSNPYTSSIGDLTDVQRGDVSDSFIKKMQQHVDQMQGAGNISAGGVDEYARSIQNAASPTNNAEQVLAGKIRDGLTGENGVLATATPTSGHPVGQAYDMLSDAQNANKQWEMAQNLGEWQRMNAAGAPIGQAPLTEAEKYYRGQPADYQSLVDLYKKNQSQFDPSWALGHMAAGAIGDIGGAMFGFSGHFLGEALGYLGAKPAIKSAFKGSKQNATGRAIQQLYPQMTGQPLTGATTGPQISPGVGDQIKNLMMGSAY